MELGHCLLRDIHHALVHVEGGSVGVFNSGQHTPAYSGTFHDTKVNDKTALQAIRNAQHIELTIYSSGQTTYWALHVKVVQILLEDNVSFHSSPGMKK